jgi:hypothetical protein
VRMDFACDESFVVALLSLFAFAKNTAPENRSCRLDYRTCDKCVKKKRKTMNLKTQKCLRWSEKVLLIGNFGPNLLLESSSPPPLFFPNKRLLLSINIPSHGVSPNTGTCHWTTKRTQRQTIFPMTTLVTLRHYILSLRQFSIISLFFLSMLACTLYIYIYIYLYLLVFVYCESSGLIIYIKVFAQSKHKSRWMHGVS